MYSIEGNERNRLDEIDSRLRVRNPAAQDVAIPSLNSLQLPGSNAKTPSGAGSQLMNISQSQFSNLDNMSSVSRRSNLTMITLKSGMTNASGKSKALPKDARLRDNAIRRMNDA